MKRLIIYSILSVVTLCSYGQSNFNKTEIKSIMKRVADWQIANPATGAEHDDLNWTYAALYMGMIDWAELTEKEDGDSQYYNWLANGKIHVSCRLHRRRTSLPGNVSEIQRPQYDVSHPGTHRIRHQPSFGQHAGTGL